MENAANVAWGQISVATKMSVGAHQAGYSDEGKTLTFKVGGRLTWIRVRYDDGADLYGVQLIKGRDCKIAANYHGVGVEELNQTIYDLVNK